MQILLENGADVNDVSATAETAPLLEAMNNNNMAVVRILLDHNADPNARDRFEMSPLLLAVMRDNAEAVEWLLQAGADPNLPQKKQSALHLASSYGLVRVAALLLAHKADPNIRDAEGQTPLHMCMSMGYWNLDLPRQLLKAGADPLLKDHHGVTAFDRAYELDKQDIMDMFKAHLAKKGVAYTPKRPPAPPSGSGGYPPYGM